MVVLWRGRLRLVWFFIFLWITRITTIAFRITRVIRRSLEGAMVSKSVETAVPVRALRLSDQKYKAVEEAAKQRGFSSASAFIRAAIDHELEGVGREAKLNEAENRIAASLERHSRDLFRLSRALQALFAVVDTLIKTFLTCVPEPPGEAKP